MKVGILSMQRVRNWGSFLQAFALQKTIEKMGHDCSFLDIKPVVGLSDEEIRQLSRECHQRGLCTKIGLAASLLLRGQLPARLKNRAAQKEFTWRYDHEFLPLLGVDPCKRVEDEEYDLVVIGSDEVFNCTQNSPFCRTLHLFGEKIKAKKIITYAASFGYTDYEALERYGLKDRVQKALGRISSISVRDQNSCRTVERLTGIRPDILIDPVLLYDFSRHVPAAVSQKDYLVVYSYPGRISDRATIRAITDYAKIKSKKIITLYSYYDWADSFVIPQTPFELLAYFKNADYVVTDTFHGSIFSIKYARNFCTIVRDSNAQKLSSLLSQFKLSHRIAAEPAAIRRLLDQEINFREPEGVLADEIQKAEKYLVGALSLS